MRYLRNELVDEFFDRSQVKAQQHKKSIFLTALIPTFLIAVFISHSSQFFEFPLIIITGMILSTLYLIFVGGSILVVDCWVIAEMTSPSVKGRYKKLKTFVQIVTNSPTRQEVLRITKLFNDVVEKNGIENYQSTSEFIKNFYDKQEIQNKKIEFLQKQINDCGENDERIIPHIARQNRKDFDFDLRLQKIEKELEKERKLRKQAEKEKADLERKYNEKTQKIGDKFRTSNNSENTITQKDSQFEEDL